ncbi:hypothetical protein VVD49_20190 [Uliginosibacterium sp. H3]|uniref:Surface antigen domain-containing protein n=1 Tax=Uliginosibacterium silvisoli TaxID=3114758 RepID=A0ABU6K913_9RHOO|nr:hypothetical protein [Uliginosibacterium sp. H3]
MKKKLFVLILGSALTSSAFAAGYGFLKGSPMSRYTKADMNLFTTTLFKALDESPDGAVSNWGDASKGAGGSIEIVAREINKKGCRTTLITNKYKTQKMEGEYLFCKQQGKWVGSPAE